MPPILPPDRAPCPPPPPPPPPPPSPGGQGLVEVVAINPVPLPDPEHKITLIMRLHAPTQPAYVGWRGGGRLLGSPDPGAGGWAPKFVQPNPVSILFYSLAHCHHFLFRWARMW